MPEEIRNPGEDGGNATDTPARPPVTEETNWRSRALEAESKLAEAQGHLADFRAKLEQAQAALAKEQQARVIDRALAGAGAIDPEVASLMLDSMLATRPDTGTNIGPLIDELRTSKPFLFESALPPQRTSPAPSAMSPALTSTPTDSLNDLATKARASGDRRSLLAYLRARRAG